MTSNKFKKFILSTEELALAFSLIDRPDLGKAVIHQTFGELTLQAINERLEAASHSLLAQQYAYIDESNTAMLSEDLRNALLPIIMFEGIIQTVVNENEPVIMNTHLGISGEFTNHWVEYGVVHHIIFGSLENLPETIAEFALLPPNSSDQLKSKILEEKLQIDMEILANLSKLGFEQGMEILKKSGFSQNLSRAFLTDLHNLKRRGSVTYLDINSQNFEKNNSENAITGLFFQIGEFNWIVVFHKNEEKQKGNVLQGTRKTFEEKINELIQKRSTSFLD